MKSSVLVLRLPVLGTRAASALAVGSVLLLCPPGVRLCDAQQLPAVKPVVITTQQQLPKPTVQLPKPSSEPLLKNLPQTAPSPMVRVTPRMVSPMNSMQSQMMGGLPQRTDERQYRTRIEPGTRDEIRERHGEQIKRHELCRRLEQRRQELLLERKERDQKATK